MRAATAHARADGTFRQRFRRQPRWLASAPGRVNLIGEHTDYNDGLVLPMAIDRRTVIAASPAPESRARITTAFSPEPVELDLTRPLKREPPAWADYARGVIAGFQETGVVVGGFDAHVESDVPSGGGLSSSAALEVALATLLETMTGTTLEPKAKALLCQHAEHTFAGVPCGVMDQFAAVFGKAGHLLLLDCRSLVATPVPLADPEIVVLIINTRVRHALADGEYARRRRQCAEAARLLGVASLRDATPALLEAARSAMHPLAFRRVRHVVSENARVLRMVTALENGDRNDMGRLMAESHASLRDDYEVSCRELDVAVEAARAAGPDVIGCRMTGGGFGGCAVALVRRPGLEDVSRRVSVFCRRHGGFEAVLFPASPGDGATCQEADRVLGTKSASDAV